VTPPGTARALRLLVGLHLRRLLNRLHRNLSRSVGGGRVATPRKSTRSAFVGLVIAGLFLLAMFLRAEHLVANLTGGSAGLSSDAVLALATAATALWLGLLCISLGNPAAELAQAARRTEWLLTFPVPVRSLLLARIGAYAVEDWWIWLTAFPLLATTYRHAGLGVAGWALAPLLTVAIALLQASARCVVEALLARWLSPARLNNARAALQLAALVLLGALYAVAFTEQVPPGVVRSAAAAGVVTAWTPFGLAVRVATSPAFALAAAATAALGVWGAVALVARMLSGRAVPGESLAVRGRAPARSSTRWPPGLAGKDLRLLLRDRTYFVRTLVAPLAAPALIAWMQWQRHPGPLRPAFAVALALGAGALLAMNGGLTTVTAEQDALWLLFALPRPLDAVLRAKSRVWSAVVTAVAAIVLAALWRPGTLDPDEIARPLVGLAGLPLLVTIVAGVAAQRTDPYADEGHRVDPVVGLLAMLVGGTFIALVCFFDLRVQVTALILLAFLARAVWIQAAESLPYLLDPVAAPPRRLSLGDGLVGALVFFATQLVATLGAHLAGLGPGATLVVAYAVGSLCAGGLAAYVFLRVQVPGAAAEAGLAAGRSLGRALLAGALLGAGTGVLGHLYVRALDALPALRFLREAAPPPPGPGWALAVVGVGLAPFAEELLFRGMILAPMRRSLPAGTAIVASALLFALVHPGVAFPPVFALGLAAGVAFTRTGWLWAAVATHAAYNAVLLLG
jgi:membrane protease YdiL (CAAX protease family)